MNINDKFNKLTDLFIEWSESGMFISDLNYRLKEIKSEEKTGWVCRTCQQSVEFKPDVKIMYDKGGYHDDIPPTPWLPNPGDGYWIISNTFDEPMKRYWGNPNPTRGELALYELGLIFKTKEEAMNKITSLLKK